MGGIDHDPVGLAGSARQLDEDPVEHPLAAPADETVVDGLVRTVILGCIAPHQTMLDDINDARRICASLTMLLNKPIMPLASI